jgi:hypothetical protein
MFSKGTFTESNNLASNENVVGLIILNHTSGLYNEDNEFDHK